MKISFSASEYHHKYHRKYHFVNIILQISFCKYHTQKTELEDAKTEDRA